MPKDESVHKVDRSLFGTTPIPSINLSEVISSVNDQRGKNSKAAISPEIKKWLMNIGKSFESKQKGIKADLIDDFNNLNSLIKLHDEMGSTSKSTVDEIKAFGKHKEELKEEFKTSFTPSNVKDLKDSIHKIQSVQARLKEQVGNYAIMCDNNFWHKIIDAAIQTKQSEINHDGHIIETEYNYIEYKTLETTEQITKEEINLKKNHETKPIKDYRQRTEVLALLRKIILIKNEWISHGRFADYASDRVLALYKYNIQPRKDDLVLLEDKLKTEKTSGLLARPENMDIYLACLEHIKKARRELRVIEMQLLASMTARLEASEQFGNLQFDDLSWAIFYKLPELAGINRPLYTTAIELYLGSNAPKRIKLRTGLTSAIAEGFHQCIQDASEEVNVAMEELRHKQQKKSLINEEPELPTQQGLIEDHQSSWMHALDIKNLLKRINRLNMFRVPNELTFEYKTPDQLEEMDDASRTDYQARNQLFYNTIIRYALNTGPANLKRFSEDQQNARNNFTFENITESGKALWLESTTQWVDKSKQEFQLLKASVLEPSQELKNLQDYIEDELTSLSDIFDALQKSEAKFVIDKCINEINDVLKRTYLVEVDVIQLVKNIGLAKVFINNIYGNPPDTFLPQLDLMEALAFEITNRLNENQYDDTFAENCMLLLNHIHPDKKDTGLDFERRKELFSTLNHLKIEYNAYFKSKTKNTRAFTDKVLYLLRPTGNLSKKQLLTEAARCTEEKPANWIQLVPLDQDSTKKIPLGFQQYFTKKLKRGIKLEFFQNKDRIMLIEDTIKLSRLINSSLESEIEIKEHLDLEAPIQAINLLSESMNHDMQTMRDSLKGKGFDDDLKAKKKCACIYQNISHRHAYLLQLAWIAKLNQLLKILENAHIKIIDNILFKKNIKHYVLDEKGINLERLSNMTVFIAKNTKGKQLLEKQTLLIEIIQKKAIDEFKILLLRLDNKEMEVSYSIGRWQGIVNFLLRNNECYNAFIQQLSVPINQIIARYDGTSSELINLFSTILRREKSGCINANPDPMIELCEKRFQYVINNVADNYKPYDIEFLEAHKNNQNVSHKVNEIILNFIETKRITKQWNKATAQFIESHAEALATYSYRLIGVDAILSLSLDKKAATDKSKAESLIKDIIIQARPDRAMPPLIPPIEEKQSQELQHMIDAHLDEPWSYVTDAVVRQFGTIKQKQQWNFNWASNALKMTQNEMKLLDMQHPLVTLKDKLIGQQNLFYFYIDYFGFENLKKLYYQIKDSTLSYMKEIIKPINLDALEEKHGELEPETEDMRNHLLHMSVAGSEFYNLFSDHDLCQQLGIEPLQQQIVKDRTRMLLSARNFNVAVKNFFHQLKNDIEQAAATLREDTRVFTMRRSQRDLLIEGNRQHAANDALETKQTDVYDYEYDENPDLFFTYYKKPTIELCLKELDILITQFELALSQNVSPAEYNEILQLWHSAGLIKEAIYLPIEWVSYSVYNEIKNYVINLEQAVKVCQIKFNIAEILYNLLNQKNYNTDYKFELILMNGLTIEFDTNSIWSKTVDLLLDAYQLAINKYVYKTLPERNLLKNPNKQFIYAPDNVYRNIEALRYLVQIVGSKEKQIFFSTLSCPHLLFQIATLLKSLPLTPSDEIKSLASCLKIAGKDLQYLINDEDNAEIFANEFFDTTMNYLKECGELKQQHDLITIFMTAFKERIALKQAKPMTLIVIHEIAFLSVKKTLLDHAVDEEKLDEISKAYLTVIEKRERFNHSINQKTSISSSEIESFAIDCEKIIPFHYLQDATDKKQMILMATSLLLYALRQMKIEDDLDNTKRLDHVIIVFSLLVSTDQFSMTLYQAKELWTQCAIRANDPSLQESRKNAHEEMMHRLIKLMLEQPIHNENLETVKLMLGETVTILSRQTHSSSAFSSSSALFSAQGSHYITPQIEYAINRVRTASIIKEIEDYLLKRHNIKKDTISPSKLTLLKTNDESKTSEITFAEKSDMNFERIGNLFAITEKRLIRKLYAVLEIYHSAIQALESGQFNFFDKLKNSVNAAHHDFNTRNTLYMPQTKYLPLLNDCHTILNKPALELCKEWHAKSSKKISLIGSIRTKAAT